jgi:hypothetical protein
VSILQPLKTFGYVALQEGQGSADMHSHVCTWSKWSCCFALGDISALQGGGGRGWQRCNCMFAIQFKINIVSCAWGHVLHPFGYMLSLRLGDSCQHLRSLQHVLTLSLPFAASRQSTTIPWSCAYQLAPCMHLSKHHMSTYFLPSLSAEQGLS